MTPLEEARNCFAAGVARRPSPPGLLEGGVDQPGGFFNTERDPRVGGAVDLPGGIGNERKCGALPERPLSEIMKRGGAGARETVIKLLSLLEARICQTLIMSALSKTRDLEKLLSREEGRFGWRSDPWLLAPGPPA